MSVCIFPHIQPVLSTIDPDNRVEVATLKFTIKYNVFSSIVSFLSCVVTAAYVQFCLFQWVYLWLSWSRSKYSWEHSRGTRLCLSLDPLGCLNLALLCTKWALDCTLFPLCAHPRWCGLTAPAVSCLFFRLKPPRCNPPASPFFYNAWNRGWKRPRWALLLPSWRSPGRRHYSGWWTGWCCSPNNSSDSYI